MKLAFIITSCHEEAIARCGLCDGNGSIEECYDDGVDIRRNLKYCYICNGYGFIIKENYLKE